MSQPLLLAIDQGTTSSRAIVFSLQGDIVAVSQQEFPQIYPAEGWVEHDPEAIWETTLATAREAVSMAEAKGGTVKAIGITNQRETTIVWDRTTGMPIGNAIVWQDRRTANVCRDLRADNVEDMVREKTGLLLDPYFSATKIAWLLDHVEGARAKADAGKLAFGTVDSFLLWHLTDGKVHATDATNASRTSLFNIKTNEWDDELLRLFKVPRAMMPEVKDCAADFGMTAPAVFGREIPILGIAGDQQAAAIGQCCFTTGETKSTYGTGCFVLVQTGEEMLLSQNRLLSTIAYRLEGKPTYALEGSIFMAGAAVQWLRDEMQIIKHAAETEGMARGIGGTQGVYIVPAFTGLGAPHWSPDARGAIFGLMRSTGKAELIRATLESVAYQTADLFTALAQDGISPTSVKVDGGMVMNDWMVQFLSDVLTLPVQRPKVMETTALGAAALAGLQAGLYGSLQDFAGVWQEDASFTPTMADAERQQLLQGWHKAVQCTLAFSQ
ncbi:glycerol kinase GlpK [Parvularcula sp. IMCC14364]|uniref:glycerol kinase GlpK n=1 Tax=Parvularcula sp. IMCC14364 TaxID=3067902 RepID=UPI00274190F9|nr:glycerol kinase GlpK [Parvularcula sp. IMCC14364]